MATFEFSSVVLNGKRLSDPPNVCSGCLESAARKRQEEADELRAVEREIKLAEERERRAANILDLLAEAGVVTPDHGRATLDNYDASGASGDKPVVAVRTLLREFRAAGKHDAVRGVYLMGETGSGKSHLAVAALRDLLLDPTIHPSNIVYDRSIELIGEIQDTYTTGQSAASVLNKRKTARFWILEDFGTEKPSDDVVRRLTEVFTVRAKRATLVTSNVDPNDLTEKNRDFFRLFSRFGPEYFTTIRVVGPDRRMQRRNAA